MKEHESIVKELMNIEEEKKQGINKLMREHIYMAEGTYWYK